MFLSFLSFFTEPAVLTKLPFYAPNASKDPITGVTAYLLALVQEIVVVATVETQKHGVETSSALYIQLQNLQQANRLQQPPHHSQTTFDKV